MDREKVIKGLEYCIKSEDCRGCIYWEEIGLHEGCPLNSDVLALLKEQEAVKPIPPTDESEMWRCGNCHHQIFRCTHQRFCERCGKPVLWEGL